MTKQLQYGGSNSLSVNKFKIILCFSSYFNTLNPYSWIRLIGSAYEDTMFYPWEILTAILNIGSQLTLIIIVSNMDS